MSSRDCRECGYVRCLGVLGYEFYCCHPFRKGVIRNLSRASRCAFYVKSVLPKDPRIVIFARRELL